MTDIKRKAKELDKKVDTDDLDDNAKIRIMSEYSKEIIMQAYLDVLNHYDYNKTKDDNSIREKSEEIAKLKARNRDLQSKYRDLDDHIAKLRFKIEDLRDIAIKPLHLTGSSEYQQYGKNEYKKSLDGIVDSVNNLAHMPNFIKQRDSKKRQPTGQKGKCTEYGSMQSLICALQELHASQ